MSMGEGENAYSPCGSMLLKETPSLEYQLIQHNTLLDTIAMLVKMKKVANQMEQDMHTVKIWLRLHESVPPGEGEMLMEVDKDGQQVPDTVTEGRALSVISTYSGRSQKQNRETHRERGKNERPLSC
jgi:hypothetical protein